MPKESILNHPSVNILGIAISRHGLDDAVEACEKRIAQGKNGYVCFVNVHTVTESTTNPELKESLNGAFLAAADGVPLVWVSRLKRNPVKTRVCGPDFTERFLTTHLDMTFGFIGGAPGRAETIARRFGVKAICYSTPIRPFSPENALEDWRNFLKLCPNGQPPSVVWIGLGAPKQELWMKTVSTQVPSVLFFGVGAAFDFLANAIQRAPIWMQKSGLEWLYRLSQEPTRLAQRYFVTNTRFTLKVAGELIREFFFPSPSACFLMGVPAIRAIGAGRLLLQLEKDNRDHDLKVSMLYTGNKSAAADAWRRRKLFAFGLSTIQHAVRKIAFRFKLATGYFSRLRVPLVIFHPQEIGSKLLIRLLTHRNGPTALFLLDSSFFCVRSYNFLPGENDACVRCVGGRFENAKIHNCKPFPINDPGLGEFLPFLREKVGKGKIRLLAQNQAQADLAIQHFGASTEVRVVGLWTVDMDDPEQPSSVRPGTAPFDVVFHGAFQGAKGFDWALEVAAHAKDLRFLFPGPIPPSLEKNALPNCEFIPMTWETGLKNQVRTARITLIPSFWSASIESALVKSLIEAPAVAVADISTAFSSELSNSLVLKLSRDPLKAATSLQQALSSSWKPDPKTRQDWLHSFEKNRSLGRRILANLV